MEGKTVFGLLEILTGSAGLGAGVVIASRMLGKLIPYLLSTSSERMGDRERFTKMLLDSEVQLRAAFAQAQEECEKKIAELSKRHTTDINRVREAMDRAYAQHQECMRERLADRQTLTGLQLQVQDLLRSRHGLGDE